MALQLALDRLTREECLKIAEETDREIDILEIGTGVIKEYGMSIIRDMRQQFPDLTLLADMKTCDAGKHEATQVFEAGADIMTVMAFSSDSTIHETVKTAQDYNGKVLVDLLEVSSRDRMADLSDLSVEKVSLHIGKDQQKTEVFDINMFELVKDFDFDVSVAGGINFDSVDMIAQKKPDTIIVGSAITKADSPKEAAVQMKERINQWGV